jgi:hypothetical protein
MNIGLHDFSITLYNLGTIAGLIKDFKTAIYRQLIFHQIVALHTKKSAIHNKRLPQNKIKKKTTDIPLFFMY